MTRTSKKTVTTAAEVLNAHLVDGRDIGDDMIIIINEILKEAAEGGRLVVARETDGTLLGFVPRSDIPIPESHAEQPPAKSPDSGK